MTPLLAYEDLHVRYDTGAHAVQGVSFALQHDECLALVGESGCGKTTLAWATLGLLPVDTRVTGSIRIGGEEIVGLDEPRLRQLRGTQIGFVAQDPFDSCSPLHRVRKFIGEAWKAHHLRPPQTAIVDELDHMGIRNPAMMLHRYPHEWSGGMLQRAAILSASAHRPPVILADEPTSALDVDLADITLTFLREACESILLVSHDIGVVKRHADRVVVMYAGQAMEIVGRNTPLTEARHPYTRALLAAIPAPNGGLPVPLEGTPPDLTQPVAGCPFAERCPYREGICTTERPALAEGVACHVVQAQPDAARSDGPRRDDTSPVTLARSRRMADGPPPLEGIGLSQTYRVGGRIIEAVKDASLRLARGEIVGVCGPSGCGKSTLLRMLATIEQPTGGEVYLGGELACRGGDGAILTPHARQGYVSAIFQDPVASLDKRWPVWRSITEPLMAPHRPDRPEPAARQRIARDYLQKVGLEHIDPQARPEQLSVGQCQRIAIARALCAQPEVIVADEPTSALDASISAAILHLLVAIAGDGVAIVIVSHDRPMLDVLCDRVLPMADGVLGVP